MMEINIQEVLRRNTKLSKQSAIYEFMYEVLKTAKYSERDTMDRLVAIEEKLLQKYESEYNKYSGE